MTEQKVPLGRNADLLELYGSCDENIKQVQAAFNVVCIPRDDALLVRGENEESVERAAACLAAMQKLLAEGTPLDEQAVRYCISLAETDNDEKVDELTRQFVLVTAKGKPIRPKTLGQSEYLQAIAQNPITFGIGPAGTGKTYLAVAMAVRAFKEREVSRIVLTRPAVEAGEKLGFLPGDLQNKVDPYLRPLYDALFDTMGAEQYQKLMEKGLIEIAPLAYMRGRTLDDAFVILDEAQNTTSEQMKMFLTRMGGGSKMVITGDITQVDLPSDKKSGLVEASRLLRGIEGIRLVYFSEKDVVRHKLVQDIIKAYERAKPAKPAGEQ